MPVPPADIAALVGIAAVIREPITCRSGQIGNQMVYIVVLIGGAQCAFFESNSMLDWPAVILVIDVAAFMSHLWLTYELSAPHAYRRTPLRQEA